MAIFEGGTSLAAADVEASRKAIRTVIAPRGVGHCISSITGTIAAALGANSSVFTMKLDNSAGSILAFIERIRIQYTTIVAYTTPVTVGRRLVISRGSGVTLPTGGTALAVAAQKDSTSSPSEFNTAQGGDMRIASTGALTTTGTTFETQEFAAMSLTHVGAAGAFFEEVFEFATTESAPLILQPGQVMAIRNPVAMDAAGTWQLAVRVDWHEAAAW